MYQYNVSQWVCFFFVYAFFGWIWECSYVSVKKALHERQWKWINRGFLHGPVIPIYGFAAISILLATIPFKDSTILIFVLGALAATLMELITGTIMEKTFHVKYWDYSDLPLNYKGHICVFVSLFWGALAVLMVKVIHVPIETYVVAVPGTIMEIIAFVMVILFTWDFKESFQEAMDLRDLLEKLEDYKVVVQRMERRMDAVIAFTPIPDIDELRELPQAAKERFVYKVEEMRTKHISRLQEIRDKLDELESTIEEKDTLKNQLEKQMKEVWARSNKQYLRVRKHLKRNPSARSKKYEDILKEIKNLLK